MNLMRILKLSIIIPALISFTHFAFADNVTTQKVAEFNMPYNFNQAFKMDAKENIAYLSSVTEEKNGNTVDKVLHLWSIQESGTTQNDPQHKVAVSNDLLNGIVDITNQDPIKLALAIHYDPNNKTSTQYIAYIDKNQKNALVILQRYPCNPTGNYCVRIISETVPISEIDTLDIAVQKDGNLLVSTVDYSRHVYLYKYITSFEGTAPAPITLVDQNSQLIIPHTTNYGQFKLVLAGYNEVPYVVFPCSSDSNGRIALANIINWDQSNTPKLWSSTYISNNSINVNINTDNSQIDAIASPNNALIHIGLIALEKDSDTSLGVMTFDSNSNSFVNSVYQQDTSSRVQEARHPVLASDGYSTYALYDLDTHAGMSKAYTSAEFINTDSSYDSRNHVFQQYEVARKDYDDEIKYTGIVMYSRDYISSYYRGFILAREGDSGNLVIKGLIFGN